MSEENKDLPVVQEESEITSLNYLSSEEKEELQKYEEEVLAKDPRRTLGTKPAAAFFELFLNGYSTKEIHNLNKAYDWGMIIHARVKYEWDEQRQEYMKDLFAGVREKVLKTQVEGIHFLNDFLSAAHKCYGDKLKMYLQTGDPTLLRGLKLESLHSYGKAVALLAKLTGQEKNIGSLEVLLKDAETKQSVTELQGKGVVVDGSIIREDGQKLLPPKVASDIVKLLLEQDKKKK